MNHLKTSESMNRFFSTNSDTLRIANHLVKLGFQEKKALIINDDDNEPIKIFIDKKERIFYFIDNVALHCSKKIIKNILNTEPGILTSQEVTKWN